MYYGGYGKYISCKKSCTDAEGNPYYENCTCEDQCPSGCSLYPGGCKRECSGGGTEDCDTATCPPLSLPPEGDPSSPSLPGGGCECLAGGGGEPVPDTDGNGCLEDSELESYVKSMCGRVLQQANNDNGGSDEADRFEPTENGRVDTSVGYSIECNGREFDSTYKCDVHGCPGTCRVMKSTCSCE